MLTNMIHIPTKFYVDRFRGTVFFFTDYSRRSYKTGLRFARGLRVERPDSIEVRDDSNSNTHAKFNEILRNFFIRLQAMSS